MKDEEREVLEKLCAAATPGPWTCGNTYQSEYYDVQGPVRGQGKSLTPDRYDFIVLAHADPDDYPNRREAYATMQFIAAAREAVPKLLASLGEAQQELTELREKMKRAEAVRKQAEHVVSHAQAGTNPYLAISDLADALAGQRRP